MIIRPYTFLKQRDYRIHEAGHFAVGTLLGLPMEIPAVFTGGGGIAAFDRETVKAKASQDDTPLEACSERVISDAALNIAKTFLAGHAAEAIHFGDDVSEVIGGRTSDFNHAWAVLEESSLLSGSLPEIDIHLAWMESVELLKSVWPRVLRVAELLDERDPTEAEKGLLIGNLRLIH